MVVRAPGIRDGAEERVHRSRAEAQLVQPGLAQGYGAGGAQALDHGRILVGLMVSVVPGSVGGPYAAGIDEVLDRHGNAVQGSAVHSGRQLAIRLLGLLEGRIGGHGDVRIQESVHQFDARQGRPGQFHGRSLPGPNRRGGLRKRCVLESVHRASFLLPGVARIAHQSAAADAGDGAANSLTGNPDCHLVPSDGTGSMRFCESVVRFQRREPWQVPRT